MGPAWSTWQSGPGDGKLEASNQASNKDAIQESRKL